MHVINGNFDNIFLHFSEVKRELRVLKSIEFSGSEASGSEAKSLEELLLEKNKALQGENTQLKVWPLIPL